MFLFFHLFIHLSFSLLVGLIFGQFWPALLGGFFIDVDHLIDYFLAFGLKFNPKYFFKGYQFLKSDKIHIFFHGWEIVIGGILLAFFVPKTLATVLLAFSVSLFVHLWLDVYIDKLPAKSYFLLYRLGHHFNLKYLVIKEHYQEHLKQKKEIKLK